MDALLKILTDPREDVNLRRSAAGGASGDRQTGGGSVGAGCLERY